MVTEELTTSHLYQVADSEKTRILSRGGSSSKMPAGPSSRPTSSGDCSGDQNRRWVSGSSGGSGRPSPAQRLHPSGGAENSRSSPRSPVSRNAAQGRGGSGSRDNTTFRSLERLSISTSRRKWAADRPPTGSQSGRRFLSFFARWVNRRFGSLLVAAETNRRMDERSCSKIQILALTVEERCLESGTHDNLVPNPQRMCTVLGEKEKQLQSIMQSCLTAKLHTVVTFRFCRLGDSFMKCRQEPSL